MGGTDGIGKGSEGEIDGHPPDEGGSEEISFARINPSKLSGWGLPKKKMSIGLFCNSLVDK